MARWNKGYDPAPLAGRIEGTRKFAADGRASFEGFAHLEHRVLLNSMVALDCKIGESERRRIVSKAMFSAAERGKITPQNLIREISKLERQFLANPLTNFRLITDVSIASYPLLRNHSIERSQIVFSPKLKRKTMQERADLLAGARHTLSAERPKNYTSLTVSVSARSTTEAANDALERLDLLRGLINYCLNRNQGVRMSSGRRKPVNKIVLGPIHTLHEPSGALATDAWWYEPQYQGPLSLYNVGPKVDVIQKFLRNVRQLLGKSRYRQELQHAIVRYVRALDLTDWEDSFLRLWSILETLTATTHGNYSTTIRRTSFLFRDRNYTTQVLSHLRDFRNRAIHAGSETNDIEALMYQAKRYVEMLLEFHIGNAGRFRGMEEAGQFLDLPNDITEIRRRIDQMRFAIQFQSP